MVFEARSSDLPFIEQVLRANESYDAVHQEGFEGSRDSVSSGLKRQLVHSMMRLGRQGASLAGFEIHHVVAFPIHVTRAMMAEHLLAALAQQLEGYPETPIRRFGSCN